MTVFYLDMLTLYTPGRASQTIGQLENPICTFQSFDPGAVTNFGQGDQLHLPQKDGPNVPKSTGGQCGL